MCFIQVPRAARVTAYVKAIPPCPTYIFIVVTWVLIVISHLPVYCAGYKFLTPTVTFKYFTFPHVAYLRVLLHARNKLKLFFITEFPDLSL